MSAFVEHLLVRCPETTHVEEVELEWTPYGVLIMECSRLQPRCALECARECAARLARDEDQRHLELALEPGGDTIRVCDS